MSSTSRSTPFKWPIFVICIVLMVIGYLMMPDDSNIEEEIGYMLRVTARIAFVFLMLAYIARPVRMLLGNVSATRNLVRAWLQHRRYLGLAMALAHTVHAGYVLALPLVLGMELELGIIIGGGLAFVLMWAMAATSNDASIRALGKNWRRLHLLGLHYLWLIFMFSFAGRIFVEDADPIYAVLVLFGFTGLLLRIWVYWSVRLRRAK